MKEEFKVNGEDLLKKVKELIHEGNINCLVRNSDKTFYLYI